METNFTFMKTTVYMKIVLGLMFFFFYYPFYQHKGQIEARQLHAAPISITAGKLKSDQYSEHECFLHSVHEIF